MTFTENNSSVLTNDTQGTQKYPHHQKQLQRCTSMHEHGTKTTPVFLPADGEASWFLLPISVFLLSGSTVQPESTYSFNDYRKIMPSIRIKSRPPLRMRKWNQCSQFTWTSTKHLQNAQANIFLLYINDLPYDVICNITMYADDTTLYSKCDQASDLLYGR